VSDIRAIMALLFNFPVFLKINNHADKYVNTDNFIFSFRGQIPTGEDIFIQDDVVKLKRCIYGAQVCIFNSFNETFIILLYNMLVTPPSG
jgi:hypothetical protein